MNSQKKRQEMGSREAGLVNYHLVLQTMGTEKGAFLFHQVAGFNLKLLWLLINAPFLEDICFYFCPLEGLSEAMVFKISTREEQI